MDSNAKPPLPGFAQTSKNQSKQPSGQLLTAAPTIRGAADQDYRVEDELWVRVWHGVSLWGVS